MLINFSNHPSANWSEAQTAAAISTYHQIVDLPFPQIDPDASIQQIIALAEEYYAQICALINYTDVYTFDFKSNAVHVMGEMNFTYNMVRLLQRTDITCLASTTKRTVKEESDGKKTSVFEFVQFRRYYSE